MEVRSYRQVFELERRIYRVDRLRLNPSGVPVRGVVYFLALLAVVALLARLPAVRELADMLPWYVRELALPALLAALLAVIRVDGRPFHLAAHAIVRFHAAPRRLAHLRPDRDHAGPLWTPPALLLIPDGSDARMRRFRYTGPGALRAALAHERRAGRGPLVALGLRAHLIVDEAAARAGVERPVGCEVIVLDRGARCRTR